MSWKVTGSLMLACVVAACATPERPTVASIDAHCSEIATTGDDYRACVELGRQKVSLPLDQQDDTLQALTVGD
jgi:hypothetical protein